MGNLYVNGYFVCKCVLVCKWVLNHCHRVFTQLQLTNISISICCYQKLCHSATGTSTFLKQQIYILQASSTSCNITSSANKLSSSLYTIVSCCGLEFQFLSVPKHSRLPSRPTRSTFCVPNPPSP
jgi:hypothetical protein